MRWVVVGAGAAGCVVASRLADHPEHDVTLIEAGSATVSGAVRSRSFFDALVDPGRTFPGDFIRGRGVGGSGAVNGMVATPGDLEQYRTWGWHDASDALARVRVPYEVADDDELGPIDRAMLAAAPDASPALLTRRAGSRVTAAEAYLGNPAIELIADTAVDRVELAADRAVGVRLADGSPVAADGVVLAAGAVGSPVLLARSGVQVPGLGDGLRNHPAVPITLRLGPGVDVDVHGLVVASLLRRDDLQILPMNHVGPDRPGEAMLLVVLMEPDGEGSVRPAEPEPVVIQRLSAHDHERLAAGVAMARQLLDDDAFRGLVDDVSVGEAPAGVFHATSTCRMGTVVDNDGAVHGYDRLHVVDASIFPAIPSANPYLPTLMLAERMAARLTA